MQKFFDREREGQAFTTNHEFCSADGLSPTALCAQGKARSIYVRVVIDKTAISSMTLTDAFLKVVCKSNEVSI